MNRRKLLGTAVALVVLGSVAFAANRVRTSAATEGPHSCTASQAAGADGMTCPYSHKHGTVAAPLDGMPADAAANSADCPHDASGKTACPRGAGADAADCPMHKTDAPPDCCKDKTTTP
jgi:hypothetical protein